MYTVVVWPRAFNIGKWRVKGAKMEGCKVVSLIVGERDMTFSRILYMTGMNGG